MGNLMKTAIFVILLCAFTNTLKIKTKIEKTMTKTTAELKHIVQPPKVEGLNKIIDEHFNITPPIVIQDTPVYQAKTAEIVEEPTTPIAQTAANVKQAVTNRVNEANHNTHPATPIAEKVANLKQAATPIRDNITANVLKHNDE